MQRLIIVSLFFLLLTVFATSASAQDLPLEECQKIQDKIYYYNDLRKKGGSAERMEEWKREREIYKDKFRDNHCRKYGKKIV